MTSTAVTPLPHQNTRPRLDRCSAHRVRAERPHRPRSRPVFGPPLRQLASDPFHPVEGGSANDYDYANGDPINQFDPSGLGPCLIGRNPNGSCRGSGAGNRLARTVLACEGRPACVALKYGTISYTYCQIGCVSISISQVGDRTSVSVSGAFCCSSPGPSVIYSPGVASPGFSGSVSAGGCYPMYLGVGPCVQAGGVPSSDGIAPLGGVGIGTRGGYFTPTYTYTIATPPRRR